MTEEVGKGILGADITQTVSAEADARRDAALDRVLGAGDDDEPAWATSEHEEDVEGDEAAEEAPKEAPDEEPEPEEQPDGDSADGEAPESPERADAEGDLERALSALRRDGLSKALLDNLSDEQILELGLKRAKVQSDTDAAYRELQELRKKESAREGTEESGASEHTVEPTSDQPSPLDFSSAVEPFAEEFGADAGTALRGALERVASPLVQQIEGLRQMLLPVMLEKTRTELGERFPGLSDNDAWSKVTDKAARFWRGGGYESEADAWDDAARAVLGRPEDRRDSDRRERARQESRARSSGQFNGNVPKTRRERPLTKDQRTDAILDAVLDGRVDEARRVAGA